MDDQQLHNPAVFAIDGMRHLRGRFGSLCTLEAPREVAAYKQARAAYLRSLPDGELPYPHPFHTMDETVFDAVSAAYEAGIVAGTRWEALRLAIVGDVAPCPRCHGFGCERGDGGRMAGSETPCFECQGTGTVDRTTLED
jgi:hypothetical protein